MILQIKDQLAELNEEVCRRDKDAHVPLGNIDMKEFDKKTRKYWRYVGSLSSPPCTENVVWNILGKVLLITQFPYTCISEMFSYRQSSTINTVSGLLVSVVWVDSCRMSWLANCRFQCRKHEHLISLQSAHTIISAIYAYSV